MNKPTTPQELSNSAAFEEKIAVLNPQPEVHIRGDGRSNYDAVGRIIYACQRAGIAKIGFITEPPPRQ